MNAFSVWECPLQLSTYNCPLAVKCNQVYSKPTYEGHTCKQFNWSISGLKSCSKKGGQTVALHLVFGKRYINWCMLGKCG